MLIDKSLAEFYRRRSELLDFDNGVTDSTGSTDEGDVRAWDIASRARQLLAIPPSSTEGTKEVEG